MKFRDIDTPIVFLSIQSTHVKNNPFCDAPLSRATFTDYFTQEDSVKGNLKTQIKKRRLLDQIIIFYKMQLL